MSSLLSSCQNRSVRTLVSVTLSNGLSNGTGLTNPLSTYRNIPDHCLLTSIRGEAEIATSYFKA